MRFVLANIYRQSSSVDDSSYVFFSYSLLTRLTCPSFIDMSTPFFLKEFVSIEADVELCGVITKVLSLFLELKKLIFMCFRFWVVEAALRPR